MSHLIEVLAKIDNAGGTVVVRDQEVRLRVRPGTLSEADRQVLADHKPDLLAMFGTVDVDTITPHSGKTGVLSTSAPESDQEPDQDLDQRLSENTVEPIVCDRCGGLDHWQSIAGTWRCVVCDPPLTAARIRERAERLRRQAPDRKPTWPIEGADEVLTLTPADLPAAPWDQDALTCFDNGKLLNEIRIDLQVIGAGGVNHRSGRLRRDVAAILAARRRTP